MTKTCLLLLPLRQSNCQQGEGSDGPLRSRTALGSPPQCPATSNTGRLPVPPLLCHDQARWRQLKHRCRHSTPTHRINRLLLQSLASSRLISEFPAKRRRRRSFLQQLALPSNARDSNSLKFSPQPLALHHSSTRRLVPPPNRLLLEARLQVLRLLLDVILSVQRRLRLEALNR